MTLDLLVVNRVPLFALRFPKAYILPQTLLNLEVESTANTSSVRIHPASIYGYAVKHHDAPVVACSR